MQNKEITLYILNAATCDLYPISPLNTQDTLEMIWPTAGDCAGAKMLVTPETTALWPLIGHHQECGPLIGCLWPALTWIVAIVRPRTLRGECWIVPRRIRSREKLALAHNGSFRLKFISQSKILRFHSFTSNNRQRKWWCILLTVYFHHH